MRTRDQVKLSKQVLSLVVVSNNSQYNPTIYPYHLSIQGYPQTGAFTCGCLQQLPKQSHYISIPSTYPGLLPNRCFHVWLSPTTPYIISLYIYTICLSRATPKQVLSLVVVSNNSQYNPTLYPYHLPIQGYPLTGAFTCGCLQQLPIYSHYISIPSASSP